MLTIGNNKASLLYIGAAKVQALWIGAVKVYEAVRSCFGSGRWRYDRPWSYKEHWKY